MNNKVYVVLEGSQTRLGEDLISVHYSYSGAVNAAKKEFKHMTEVESVDFLLTNEFGYVTIREEIIED